MRSLLAMKRRHKISSFARSGLAAVALALVAGLAAAPLLGQSPPGDKQTGFQLVDDYVLAVDGEEQPQAEIFSSSSSRAILVTWSDLAPPVLLWPRSRVVETLRPLSVAKRGDEYREILLDPVLAIQPAFEVVGTNVVFQSEGVELRLMPKPPLVGLRDADAMLGSSRVYARRAEAYAPAAEALDSLSTLSQSVRVRVFFGTWCPACGQMVPRILSVARKLAGTGLEFEFYGLPRGFRGNPEATRYNIESVPTGVIFVDGVEVGRLSGNDWRQPESALWELLGS